MDPTNGHFMDQNFNIPPFISSLIEPNVSEAETYFEDQKPDVNKLNEALDSGMELNEFNGTLKPARKRKKRRPPNLIDSENNVEGISFYGCSVCNVKYDTMKDLQSHILTHKDRVTSWDLKIKRQKLRKKLKKEMKKRKKLKLEDKEVKLDEVKIKEEPIDPDYNDPSVNLENINNVSSNNVNSDTVSNNSIIVSNKKVNNDTAKVADSNEEAKNNLEKIFKCGLCLKQFTLGYYLKLHIRSHTGEKPYQCAECGLSFITASKLGRHRKKTHLSIRFECRICHRPYTRLEFLTRHFNKQHPDDKIEGEPYDYNAILPYLKELTEELEKKKAEEEEKASKQVSEFNNDFEVKKDEDVKDPVKEEDKPKVEAMELIMADADNIELDTAEQDSDDAKPLHSKVEPKEEIKVEPDVSQLGVGPDEQYCFVPVDEVVELKQEPPVDDTRPLDDTHHDDDDHDRDFSQTDSDSDYFPANTWLAPQEELEPLPKRNSKQFKSAEIMDCQHCGKKVKGSYMRIHLRTHTQERPYKCDKCNKSFITASKRNRHSWTHLEHRDNDVKSEEDETIKTEPDGGSSKKQKKRKRKVKKEKVEPDGSVEVKTEPLEIKPVRKRTLACQFCPKKFVHKEALQVHELTHEGQTKQPTCQFCLTEFEDEISLEVHEGEHVGENKYLCTLCGKTYKKKETMVYHRRSHVNGNRFQCDACPASFDALCKLRRHLYRHRETKYQLKYECPVCAHLFHTRYHIQKHLVVHEKEGLIQEDNRGDILAMVLQNVRRIPLEPDQQSNLKGLIPTEERSRICNICGEIFQHFYLLETHLKSHGSKIYEDDEAEKKYICQVCNKGFKLHYYLKLHSYTHTKEKPFVCTQCGKGFITKGKLKRHIETHQGLKKYQCHICLKFFTRPSYLRIHVRTIHAAQEFNKMQAEWAGDAMQM